MKYCRILLCMTALAACLLIGNVWGGDYLEGGTFRSIDRSMMMDPEISGMVQWLDAPISSFPWYSSDLTFYRQAVPSSTFTPYREYYKTTGTPVVSGIVTNPVKFDITQDTPYGIYYGNGQGLPYSQYASSVPSKTCRRGRVRVHGGRVAAAARRPPGDRGRTRHGRQQRREPGRRSVPGPRAGLSRHGARPAGRRRSPRLRLRVLPAAPRREPGPAARDRQQRARHRSRCRLPPPRRRVHERWRGEAHAAPEMIGRFALRARRALPRRSRHACARGGPGLLPDRGEPCAPLFTLDLVEPHLIADTVSGVVGAGRGLKVTSLFSEANENVSVYSLLTHFHTPEMELALEQGSASPGRRVVHAASRSRDARDPRDLLRPPRASGLSTARLLEHYREYVRGRSVRHRCRRAVGDEGDLRRQRRARHDPLRRADATGSSRSRPRTTS